MRYNSCMLSPQLGKKQTHLQFFGSSSARFDTDSRRLRTAGGSPGPGTYSMQGAFANQNTATNNNSNQLQGVGFTGSSRRFQVSYCTCDSKNITLAIYTHHLISNSDCIMHNILFIIFYCYECDKCRPNTTQLGLDLDGQILMFTVSQKYWKENLLVDVLHSVPPRRSFSCQEVVRVKVLVRVHTQVHISKARRFVKERHLSVILVCAITLC